MSHSADGAAESSDGHGAAPLSGRLTLLAQVAAELQSVANLERLTNLVVSHLADSAGAAAASLSLLVAPDTLAMIGMRGGVPGGSARCASYPVDSTTPAGDVARTGRPVVLLDRESIERRYPDLPLPTPGERSVVALPLVVNDEPVAVATLSFARAGAVSDADLEFYRVMVDLCAQALGRIRVQERVAEQHAKLRLLAEASTELASSLDYESTLKNVAWLAVPDLADWCAISLEQDGFLRTLAVAHRDPRKLAMAEKLQERYPAHPDAPSGSYQVLRSGQSLLIAEISEELLLENAQDEEHARLIKELNLRSALTVALKARGRVFGTISWVNGETTRRFGPDDVAFGEDLAQRAAVAIDNALLHSELREVADRLQEAVLPPALPVLDTWRLSAAYRSAGRVSVGGDFYDAIPLPDGRLALAIGDVMGRGVEAAAAMAQIRAALRAFVAVDPDPEVVLHRLDLLYERYPSEQLVTLIYALADTDRDRVVLGCAGHPPPLLLRPDGTTELLTGAHGRILGVGCTDRRASVVPLGPGDTLLLYTDGLVERRGEDPETGQGRLAAVCRELRPESDPVQLQRLVELMRDPDRDDDVAVLAAQRVPQRG